MKSEKELRKHYFIRVDDNEKLITFNYNIDIGSEEDEDLVLKLTELIRDDFYKIFNNSPDKKFGILVDFTKLSKVKSISSKLRKIWLEIALHKSVNKLAILSRDIFLKIVVIFMVRAVKKEDKVKWFKKQEEAISWLKIK